MARHVPARGRLVIPPPCVSLTTSVVQKDYTRMLKDYVKLFAERIGRFFSEDELGTSSLEAGKTVITVLESGKLCDAFK
ncbi:hypothetical protein TSMEX_005700 [Taenia solium]|eukprot:TsM_000803100 transcript=TsM_000803100 gene=TsM_000803100